MTAAAEPVAPSWGVEINGRPLRVFDGLLANPGEYARALARAAFTRTEIARSDTAGHRHWVAETRLDALLRQPIFALTAGVIRGFEDAGLRYRPYRAYTNVAVYGDMLFSHVDCLPGQRELTALWYLCDDWDLEWGGETVFFDERDEIAHSILPRPGRLVVFDGAIKHVGRPPNRICYASRYTFAIKFEQIPVT